ncbi:hypothetical protein AAF712_002145 [Marasmius tenuissimus]|uniref:Uncharacterized protein n=1 Tax=Marasmius tenuissimus TaxID=585030 RepID=A0ABR3AC75_9AGAR|nr:hypothetical protein PM082_005229 [Marasmius tenuissimus]
MSVEQTNSGDGSGSFLSNILTPGSSLHPTFLLILDVAFVALLLILLGLLFATRSLHFAGLIFIELCLWASVKWFVYELQKVPEEKKLEADSKKDK